MKQITLVIFLFFIVCQGNVLFPQGTKRIYSNNDSTYQHFNRIQADIQPEDKGNLTDLNNLPKYAPGELIIKYKAGSFSKSNSGTEIISEYEKFKSLVEKSLDKKIKIYKPVYNSIVSVMIEKNMTEQQVKQEFIKERAGKRISASVINDELFNTEYSRTIVVTFSDISVDPVELSSLITSDTRFINNGFNIEYAEPNYLFYANASFNDPFYSAQWAHKKTHAADGWDIETGSPNIKIGIIDTGIDYTHEDLLQNYNAGLSSDFVDIDTISYINNHYVLIADEDYTKTDDDPKDYNGHGTHCAGIAAARGNNGIGITGVAPDCQIVALRSGFSILLYGTEYGIFENDDIANAIIYAISENIDVLSMSFGGTEASITINKAITNAFNSGIIIVAAAGNNSLGQVEYPAGYPGVISVAATNSSDKRASFSNYGSWVDIAAPGESIYSTVPKKGGSNTQASGYKYLDGTSMAAPYVAGLAALILSKYPSYTPEYVEYAIKKSADTPEEASVYIGAGRVNVLGALQITNPKTDKLYVELTTPLNGAVITEKTDFIGFVQGTNYKLALGKGIYPVTWIVIDSGKSGPYGKLGTLDPSALPLGRYTVKLETWNETDEISISSSIILEKKENYHQGFPLTIKSLRNIPPTSFNVADVDNDNKKDIITVSGSSVKSYCSAISVYNSEGQMLPGWPKDLPFNSTASSDPVIADLDADGKQEILVLGLDPSDNTKFMMVFNNKGETFAGWPRKLRGTTNEFSVSDLNLDGKAEVVCGGSEKFYVIRYDGTDLPGWPVKLFNDYYTRSPFVLSNMDNDPELEIAMTIFSGTESYYYTCAFNIDGTPVTGYPYKQDFWGWCLAGGDINNDGRIEIITQEGPLSSTGAKMPWANSSMSSWSPIAIGNLNSDSYLEVLYGDGYGYANLENFKGQSLSGWPIKEGSFTADGKNLIADIAGDDTPEIIIPWVSNTTESTDSKAGIYAYNSNGTIVEGFPKLVDDNSIAKVAVDDIDNDGFTELLCLDADLGELIMFDLDKPFKSVNNQWQSYHHDSWNTGAYPYYRNNVLPDFKPFSLLEDDSLSIQLSPYYVTWNDYTVNLNTDSSSTTSFNNGILKYKPALNLNGQESVSASAQGPNGYDSTSVFINIIPLNDAPYLSSSLPSPVINEDAGESIIINKIEDYFKDYDPSDKLTFSASAGPGLDSIKVINADSATAKNRNSAPALNKNVSADNALKKSLKSGPMSSEEEGIHRLLVYPSKDFNGIVKVFIKAVDDSLAVVSDTLLLKINPVNDIPEIASIQDIIMREDDSVNVIIKAFDNDKDTLIFSGFNRNNNFIFNSTDSVVSLRPVKNWNGIDTISVFVTDKKDSSSVQFQLTVLPVNDAPEIAVPLPDAVINEDDSSAVVLFNAGKYFKDPENDRIYYSAIISGKGLDSLAFVIQLPDTSGNYSKPVSLKRITKNFKQESRGQESASISINKKQQNKNTPVNSIVLSSTDSSIINLVVYPSLNYNGEVKIEITASDDSLAKSIDTIAVKINPVNDKPLIAAIGDKQIDEDTKLRVPITVSDADNDNLSFALKSSSDSLNMVIRNGILEITPFTDWFGNSVITVYVNDKVDKDSVQFTLSVLPVNDKPGNFSILAPVENTILFLTDSLVSDSAAFRWSKASNTDKEKMLYSLFISDSLHSLLVPAINDTIINVAMSQFKGWVNNSISKCKWYVKVYDLQDTVNSSNGSFTLIITDKTTGINDAGLPVEYALFQNYPNPFNPSTNIKFNVPERSLVTMKIYNVLGEEVTTLVNEELDAGSYTVVFSSSIISNLSSGIYFYSLRAGDFRQVMKMVLMK